MTGEGECSLCRTGHVFKNLKLHMIKQHAARPDPHYKRQQAWQARMRKLRAERRLIAYAHVLIEAFGDD